MNIKRAAVIAGTTLVLAVACGGGASASSTSNDHVLKGQDFQEFFKDDGDGKNYLYTTSIIDAPAPGKCIVLTGASEQTITVTCNYGGK